MTGCCSEHGCTRRTPIGIFRGWLSGQVYAATRMRLISEDGGHSGTFEASVKHDITPQLKSFIRANREWVLSVLESRLDDEP